MNINLSLKVCAAIFGLVFPYLMCQTEASAFFGILYMTVMVTKCDAWTENLMYSKSFEYGYVSTFIWHSLFASGPLFLSLKFLILVLDAKLSKQSEDVLFFLNVPGDSNTGDHGNPQENLGRMLLNALGPLGIIVFMFSSLFAGPNDQKQVLIFQYCCSGWFIGF